MGTRTTGEPEDYSERVGMLLAAVQDMSSYLLSVSRQLEREVGQALECERSSTSARAEVEALRMENAQLREALDGRALIERAKGMLMAIHRCNEDAAFHLLVTTSRQERRKLRLVASEVVDRCSEPALSTEAMVGPQRETAGRASDRTQAPAPALPDPSEGPVRRPAAARD
jgi:ANTAR domain